MQDRNPVEFEGIGVDQQLVGVEPPSARRLERPVGAQAVKGLRPRRRRSCRGTLVPVRPGRAMRAVSTAPASSYRQTSIALAPADQTATLSPSGSRVAPSGSGEALARHRLARRGRHPRARALGDQRAEEIGVAPRRPGPGDVAGHAVGLEPAPVAGLAIEPRRAPDRALQHRRVPLARTGSPSPPRPPAPWARRRSPYRPAPRPGRQPEPLRSAGAQSWVRPQGSKREGTSRASHPAWIWWARVSSWPKSQPTRPRWSRAATRKPACNASSPDPRRASCAPSASRDGRASSSRSSPFCQLSRLTTPNSGAAGSGSSPRRVCRASLLAARASRAPTS